MTGIGLPVTMTQPRKADVKERGMAEAPISSKGKRGRAFYERARALGMVGGFIGVGVGAWTAIDEAGGPIGAIAPIGLCLAPNL